jgi:hypothetical protein
MSTYSELQQRVATDYLNRGDFTDQVKRSIKAAIRHYERRRWRFNETSSAIACSAGQTFISLPSNFLVLDTLQITYAGSRSKLHPREFDFILEMNAASATGVPTDFALRSNRIELAVVPDSAYSCPLYYIKSLTELSADSDTNSWTTGAHEDLIVYHATKLMWANVLRNTEEAMKYGQLEALALNTLDGEYLQYSSQGITPTRF